jgi:hypothetical protein
VRIYFPGNGCHTGGPRRFDSLYCHFLEICNWGVNLMTSLINCAQLPKIRLRSLGMELCVDKFLENSSFRALR